MTNDFISQIDYAISEGKKPILIEMEPGYGVVNHLLDNYKTLLCSVPYGADPSSVYYFSTEGSRLPIQFEFLCKENPEKRCLLVFDGIERASEEVVSKLFKEVIFSTDWPANAQIICTYMSGYNHSTIGQALQEYRDNFATISTTDSLVSKEAPIIPTVLSDTNLGNHIKDIIEESSKPILLKGYSNDDRMSWLTKTFKCIVGTRVDLYHLDQVPCPLTRTIKQLTELCEANPYETCLLVVDDVGGLTTLDIVNVFYEINHGNLPRNAQVVFLEHQISKYKDLLVIPEKDVTTIDMRDGLIIEDPTTHLGKR